MAENKRTDARRQYEARYREAHPERRRAQDRASYCRRKADPAKWARMQALNRARCLRFQFGITAEEYGRLLEAQGGRCKACGRPEVVVRNGKVKALAVDHEHATGRVRGLLCQACNTLIGQAGESVEVLRAAVAYLEGA